MTDYSKMTKAELIEALNLAYLDISALENVNEYLEGQFHQPPTYHPGWWVGVVLLGVCLVPWVFVAVWVMS